MRTRTATYPDRETAQWATQQTVTANEQAIHRWLAQPQPGWQSGVECKCTRELDCETDGSSRDESRD